MQPIPKINWSSMALEFIFTVPLQKDSIRNMRVIGTVTENRELANSQSLDSSPMKDNSKTAAITNTVKWCGTMETVTKALGKRAGCREAVFSSTTRDSL